MSDRNARVPKLRFPEFRDAGDWEEKRLGEVVDILQGFGFPEKYQGKKDGKYPFYKVSDISNALASGTHFIVKSANYIDDDDLANLRVREIPRGTTIFAKIGEAIRSNRRAITTKECVIDNNTAGIKAKKGKANDLFVFYTYSKVNLIDYSGGVVPSVNKTTMENIIIAVPKLPEQQKIAACLTSLDDLITAEAQKLVALKTYKKGLMQQLFPQKGQTNPRLRFPEFRDAGDWNVATIDQIGSVSSGGTPSRKIPEYWNGDIPWVSTTLIDFNTIEIVNEYITKVGLQNSSAKIFPKTTILMAMYGQGKTRGKVAMLGIDAAINQACAAIAVNEGIKAEFVFQNLGARYDEIREISNQGGQENLSGGIIKKIPFSYPYIKSGEQQKIADCLTSVDDLISAHGQKLDVLKAHKKGMMQQIFPAADEVGG